MIASGGLQDALDVAKAIALGPLAPEWQGIF